MKLSEKIHIRANDGITTFHPYYGVLNEWAEEAANLESERDCLLLAIKYYDLADMLDKDRAEILDMCAKGIVPPYARDALFAEDAPSEVPLSDVPITP